jgi:hypothetical protein
VVVVVDGVEEGEEGEEGRGQGGAEEVDANDEAEDREEEDGAGEGDGEDGVRGGRGGGGVGVVAEGHGRGQWLVDSVLVFLDGLVSKWTSKSHLGRTWSDSWIWLPAGAMVGIELESNISLLVHENIEMLCPVDFSTTTPTSKRLLEKV